METAKWISYSNGYHFHGYHIHPGNPRDNNFHRIYEFEFLLVMMEYYCIVAEPK